MQNQINTTPITQLVQLIKAAELSQSKEIRIPIQQARLLNLSLTEILIKMNQDYETMYNALKASVNPDVVSVQLDGGGFGNPE